MFLRYHYLGGRQEHEWEVPEEAIQLPRWEVRGWTRVRTELHFGRGQKEATF